VLHTHAPEPAAECGALSPRHDHCGGGPANWPTRVSANGVIGRLNQPGQGPSTLYRAGETRPRCCDDHRHRSCHSHRSRFDASVRGVSDHAASLAGSRGDPRLHRYES
jgi:hypothetical protein